MSRLLCSLVLVVGITQTVIAQEQEKAIEKTPEQAAVFSGPQKGEKLAALNVKGVYGEQAGKSWNLVEANADEPKLLIFVHKRERPAFGLTRVLMNYVSKRKDDKLTGGVIWLTEDATETENWLGKVKTYFPQNKRMPVVYSPDGVEGPGAYGLNRNVTMTILVVDKNRVTENFALVQPSLQADFPKIMQSVIKAAGGEMPKLEDLEQRAMRKPERPAQRGNDEKLTGILRQFIQKDATDEELKKLAEQIETYIKDKPAVQSQLGEIVSRIEAANRLSNYGTETAQTQLRAWGKKYGPQETPQEKPKTDRKE